MKSHSLFLHFFALRLTELVNFCALLCSFKLALESLPIILQNGISDIEPFVAQVWFLPANRFISPEDETHILLLKESDLAVRQIIRVLELEKNVEHGELPFLEKIFITFLIREWRILRTSGPLFFGRYNLQDNKHVKVDVVIQEIIERQSHDNMFTVTKYVLKVKSPLQKQASQVLSLFAFEKFKE
ncbi:hypothetical protein VNO78_01150 [Psophocarpus tetragonolobus]|uniref:FAR1-related sequence 11-like HTH-like domain-containing protein n=1 Tax=Psophocarpus tetragonolobus TaxID=3891 RepID=A0AAN9T1C3_PSOTE